MFCVVRRYGRKVLTSGRGIHGAPMRETVVYLMMGVSRDVEDGWSTSRRRMSGTGDFTAFSLAKPRSIVGVGVVGIAIGQLLRAFDMHVVGVTRTPRAGRGF